MKTIQKLTPLFLIAIFLVSFTLASEVCTDEDSDGMCLEITKPSGGTFEVGDNVEIEWKQAGIDKVTIFSMVSEGLHGPEVVHSHLVDPNMTEQSYEWTIPEELGGRPDVFFWILAYGSSQDSAYSEKFDVRGTCEDSDGGKTFDTKGTVDANGHSYTDICITGCTGEECYQQPALKEYYCNDINAHEIEYHECEYSCEAGRCTNCADECLEGQKGCYNGGWRECGEYDEDDCLDWSSVHSCAEGCNEGKCNEIDVSIGDFDFLEEPKKLHPNTLALYVSNNGANVVSSKDLTFNFKIDDEAVDLQLKNNVEIPPGQKLSVYLLMAFTDEEGETPVAVSVDAVSPRVEITPDDNSITKTINVATSYSQGCGQHPYQIHCTDDPGCYWDSKSEKCYDYRLKCSDPDGGKDLYDKGKTFGYPENPDNPVDKRIRSVGEDSCIGHEIKEYYCEDDYYIESYTTECPDECEDGECIQKTIETDLSDYPDMFIKQYKFNGLLVVGKKAPSVDTIAMTNIAMGLQSKTITETEICNDNSCQIQKQVNQIPKSATKFDDEVTLDSNLISVGNPCNNKITAKIMGSDDCDYKLEDNKAGIIYLKRYGDNYHLAVYGSNNDNTRKASTILQNMDEYELSGTTHYMYGETDPEKDSTKDQDSKADKQQDNPEPECSKNSDCNDNKASTKDICRGSKCVNKIITECQNDDYCPENCNYKNDPDCDECQTSTDCNDNNPCTIDSCENNPKRCINKDQSGCNLDGTCVPIGTRDNNQYCSKDNKLKLQKAEDEQCDNSYECSSNLCVDSKCIKKGFFDKIVNWFKNIFG